MAFCFSCDSAMLVAQNLLDALEPCCQLREREMLGLTPLMVESGKAFIVPEFETPFNGLYVLGVDC